MSSPYYAPPIDKPGPIYGPNYGPPPQFQQQQPGQASFPQPYPQIQPYYNYQAQPQAQCQPQVVYVQQPAPKPPNNSGGGGCCLPCAFLAGCFTALICCPCGICC